MVEFTDENSKMLLRLAITEEKDAVNAAEAVVDAAIWKRALQLSTVNTNPVNINLGKTESGKTNSTSKFGVGITAPLKTGQVVSEETRQALVQLVLKDPLMTPFLFTDEAWERH